MADDTLLRQTREEGMLANFANGYDEARRASVCWRWMAMMAMPAVPALILVGAHDLLERQPTVETVFALVGEETRILHTSVAQDWTFDESARADIAWQWVFNIRNRQLLDNPTLQLRRRARALTGDDTPAIAKAETMLAEIDAALKCDRDRGKCQFGLGATEIEAVPIGTDEETDTTVVAVVWHERTFDSEGHDGEERTWHQYLNVQPAEPISTAQALANPTKLYVVDMTPIVEGRPNAKVASK